MSYTERFTEGFELLGSIAGDDLAAANVSDTGNMLFENFHRGVIIIHPVTLNDALDIDVEQATDATAGTRATFNAGSKDVLIAAGDTKPTVIEIKSEEFDVDGLYKYLNIEATLANTAGNNNVYVIEVWGSIPRYKPTSTALLDSVVD